jgi:hypothetical protein
MKSIYLFLIVALLCCGSASAESRDGVTELTIYSGISFLETEHEEFPDILLRPDAPFDYHFESSFDGGFLFGFKGGYYFNENVELEGNFAIAPNQKLRTESFFDCPVAEICPLFDFFPPIFFDEQNGVSYYYDGNLVYNFDLRNLTPFVSVGLGGITNDFEVENHTDFSLNFGGGAKFNFGKVGVRIEVNDHVIPDHFLTEETEHDVQVHYGLLVRL